MAAVTPDSLTGIVSLPAAAPKVRVTVGEGSVGGKSWNLRRPVTLIGSQRRAQIVLHDPDTSRAHCVIVNTGNEVLLKDLHTPSGTSCNGRRVDLVVLQDGDQIEVGATSVRVSISRRMASDEQAGLATPLTRTTTLRVPFALRDEAGGRTWPVDQAVTLIGNGSAEINLDDPDVSAAHAILFKLDGATIVFDLSGTGLAIDGESVAQARVRPGQVLTIGKHRLRLVDNLMSSVAGPVAKPASRDVHAGVRPVGGHPAASTNRPSRSPAASVSSDVGTADLSEQASEPLARVVAKLAELQAEVGDSWERLNTPTSQRADESAAFDPLPSDLNTIARELDKRDAALRGHLHDLTRLLEQLVDHERGLTAQSKRIHEERLKLFSDQASWAKRKEELDRQATQLARLERMLADRQNGRPQAGQ